MNTFWMDADNESKSISLKKKIIGYYINNGDTTISDLAKEIELSIPTTTKLVSDLIEEGIVLDYGKVETMGGRRPNIYGVNPASGYFIGVEVRRMYLNFGVINFKGEIIEEKYNVDYKLENTIDSLNQMCKLIEDFIIETEIPKSKFVSIGINLTGRVNTDSGYSYSYFLFNERPLTTIIEEQIGIHVTLDNDSRAMAYGEYMCGSVKGEKNIIFVNVSWGLGIGIIIDGKLYYGKSGFSGEFGHCGVYDNEIICRCGKKGCIETEASGSAMYRKLMEKYNDGCTTILSKKIEKGIDITLEDIISAIHKEDMLSIEIVEEVGNKLGRNLAGLINIFNPDLLIIGGSVSQAGEYILLPIKSAIRKHSLNLVSKDSVITTSKLGKRAGMIGACMLARSKTLGLI